MRAVFGALRFFLLGVMLGGVLFAAGFALFASAIQQGTGAPRAAQAIVALTGGKARIGQAVNLLAQGKAKRLLISGVHPSTRASQLQRLVPGGADFFPCCVDLGRAAVDTRGNAAETSAWVARHGYRSLIVVTSDYHIPRTLIEFAWAMPEVQLIAHPVSSPDLQIGNWWSHSGTRRVLFVEYMKYLNTLAQYAGSRVVAGFGGTARSTASAN